MIVLSQFWTLTVWSATSITSPSAPYFGISIQSPTWIMSLPVSCTEATSDRIVSRNTSSSTAVIAPMPDRKSSGERSIKVATTSSPAIR